MMLYAKIIVILYKSKQKKGANKMKYEVKAVEQFVQVDCDERIPDDILEKLKVPAEERKSVWNTDACRTMFIVACKNAETQKALLNQYAFLLDFNWK